MSQGAGTPEELEALFEDAFVVRDRRAVASLFEDSSVLAYPAAPRMAHGRAAITALVERIWDTDHTYVADPRQVLQAGDTALVIGSHVINVLRQSRGGWRYAIALVDRFDDNTTERQWT